MSDIEIKFGFDPFASETLEPVVDDCVAFSLWSLWKRNHIVSDKFLPAVLSVSRAVREYRPKDVASLRQCFPYFSHEFSSADLAEFNAEWLSVLTGETQLFMMIGGKRHHCKIDFESIADVPEQEGLST